MNDNDGYHVFVTDDNEEIVVRFIEAGEEMNFSDLPAGDYCVYGISYNTENPYNQEAQTLREIVDGEGCFDLSDCLSVTFGGENCEPDFCSTVPPTVFEEEQYICAGDTIALPNIESNEDTIEWYYLQFDGETTAEQLIEQPEQFVIPTPYDGCQDEITIEARSTVCPDKLYYGTFYVVFAPLEAALESDDCGVSVQNANCNPFLNISWEDNLGNQGEGFSYNPEAGTSGMVTFTISFPSAVVHDLSCGEITLVTSFECAVDPNCAKPKMHKSL